MNTDSEHEDRVVGVQAGGREGGSQEEEYGGRKTGGEGGGGREGGRVRGREEGMEGVTVREALLQLAVLLVWRQQQG